MKLTEDQINILRDGKIEDNRFYLQWQLDRKQYVNINTVLETIWLKWNRKQKAHIVEWLTEEDLQDAIIDICETWEVETIQDTIKKFQFYPTPKELAQKLVELAELKETDKVLEPSAWQGAISDLIMKNKKTLVELKDDNFNILKEKEFYNDDCRVVNRDFLKCYIKDLWKFQKIIANPPFSKSQDVKHILHMYDLLEKWWRLVSIASSSIETRQGKLYEQFRNLDPQFIKIKENSFKESWTMVNTVIVIINK